MLGQRASFSPFLTKHEQVESKKKKAAACSPFLSSFLFLACIHFLKHGPVASSHSKFITESLMLSMTLRYIAPSFPTSLFNAKQGLSIARPCQSRQQREGLVCKLESTAQLKSLFYVCSLEERKFSLLTGPTRPPLVGPPDSWQVTCSLARSLGLKQLLLQEVLD